MASLAIPTIEPPKKTPSPIVDLPRLLVLELSVTDSDCIKELLLHAEGAEREQYSLSALRVGLLSLRHARGQVDADAVKREGERLLGDIKYALETNRAQMNESLTSCLREYFDPASGKFQDRVERLIKRDGDLEQLLRRQIGSDSEMVRTLSFCFSSSSACPCSSSPSPHGSFASVSLRSS